MCSIKLVIIAVVATLTPLLALALDSNGASNSDPQLQKVVCKQAEASEEGTVSASNGKNEEASETVIVSMPNSTVDFVCPKTYTFEPAAPDEAGKQKVYSNALCTTMKPLTEYCPTATLVVVKTTKPEASIPGGASKAGETREEEVDKPAATLRVGELPAKKAVFYVQCKPPKNEETVEKKAAQASASCVVEVTVNQAANTGVHICKRPSITVKVPDKDSSVQFSCDEKFNLYPADPAKVFKDDCRTEEPLREMKRTASGAAPASGSAGARSPPGDAAAPPLYTLKAVKKPPKRKLCYLCATQDPGDKAAKPPEDYCAIYVESSARARQFGLGFTPLALVLSSVLAVFRLT